MYIMFHVATKCLTEVCYDVQQPRRQGCCYPVNYPAFQFLFQPLAALVRFALWSVSVLRFLVEMVCLKLYPCLMTWRLL